MSNREEKKARFAEESDKAKPLIQMIVAVLVVVVAAASLWFFSSSTDDSKYLNAQNGKISVPLNEVNDGLAHYYKYKAGGQDISFFLLKSQDGVVRAALDACDVCFKALKGYRQEGDFMVCNNCDQKFETNMINVVKGGCNPAPLSRSVIDDKVVLLERELVDGRRYFPSQG